MKTINEMREEKVKTYYKDIKMKETSREKSMLELVVSELVEIKMHLCNGREFEAGVGLGGLINSLLNRQDMLEEDEEIQDEDEDEECEESPEEEDNSELYRRMYLEEKQHRELIEKKLILCKVYLKQILKKDHIFKDSIPQCVTLFEELGYSSEEIKWMLPGTPMGGR